MVEGIAKLDDIQTFVRKEKWEKGLVFLVISMYHDWPLHIVVINQYQVE